MITFVLVLSTLSTGLIAGLFYAYSCSVNPGLGRLSDGEYLSAMQSINRAILNPVFFMTFMGTVVLLPISAWLCYQGHPSRQFWYFLAAAILYIVGAFGITMGGNVPLNDALDKFNLVGASPEQLAQYRSQFEGKWNMLHSVRTIANIASFLFAILGCMARVK